MPGFGFPRKLRLTESAQFRAVFNTAEFKVSNGQLLILACCNQLDHGRLGLVIGKKHLPRAVQRNRVKRLLRTSFRLNQALLQGLDIVILARSNMSGLDNSRIARAVEDLWRDLVKKSALNPHNPTHHKQTPSVPR